MSAPLPAPEMVLSEAEAARLMRISVDSLSGWRRRGYGPPAHRVGGKVLFLRSEIINWIARQPARPGEAGAEEDAGEK